MSPPKTTHPLAHLPDPPQNYIPCAPTKYWPSTMDEEQHSSQGNKWWWLVYLGPMQGAYATRATAVANVPSASKIENTIEYFDTLTDLNSGWKKSYFHWHGHCPVHFACASVCDHPKPTPAVQTNEQTTASARNSVCAAQRTAMRVPNDSAGSISVFRMLGALHRRPRTTLLAALATFHVLGLLRAFPEAGAKVEEYLVGPHRQIRLHASIHHRHSHSAICDARSTLLPLQHTLKTLPPSSSPPAYSPPSRSLSPPVATRQRPCLDPVPSWEFSMSTGGKSRPEPDRRVKTEPKPRTKTEPEPHIKWEVKLKLNLQHDVEHSRSHSHAPVPLQPRFGVG
ncbi:hypothetical protein B0H13DRAFT_2355973 [Mycena leptocephala]|nr:hypothetical protein B0H13DRAFT_2355973 [Mycena leptocephala]